MAGNNNKINIELRNPSLVNNYDRPDQSILHDIDPDYNYFNAINTVNSEYYNESSFNRHYGNSSNFSIFHLNIRSVISHFRELLGYLDTLDIMFKVIGLSETAINETSISYDIPSYNCEIDIRSARKGGGVSLYILDTLQYKLRNDLQLGGEVNSVFIEIFKTSSNTKRNIVCGCVYRPPSMSLVKFNELLSHMFGKLHSENKYIYIMGDFNVNTLPHIRGSLSVQEFKNIFAANYCFPLINKPTRLTSTSSSLIDNIYSTMPALANGCDSGILEISISDHYGIFTVDKNTTILEEKTETKKRSFCNKNIVKFCQALRRESWDSVYSCDDAQVAYSRFKRAIDMHFTSNFKFHTFAMTYKNRYPWLSAALRTQIKLKNAKHKEALKSNDQTVKDEYKNIKRELHSSLRNSEISYYSNQLDLHRLDVGKRWKVLREILNMNNPSSKKKLIFDINNKTTTDPNEIATGFNNFFVTIGPQLAKNIKSNINPLSYVKSVNNSMVLTDVTSTEVRNVIASLKNSSSGYDEFPPFVGKACVEAYIKPLTHLINVSLKSGVFPSELKLAKVVPIFKAGDTSAINNYRPISVLSFFSKVYEKIVYNHVLDFVDDNNVLYDYQYGFRHSHSTQQAIITLIDRISKSLDKGDIAIIILLDLKKAFDTVDHRILLRKLYAYGIRGTLLKWFESYLTGRTQYVAFNGTNSDTHYVKCGVPQGSILGPLLFILYMNDICSVSKLLFTLLYADDTCVLLSGKDLDDLIAVLNVELISLSVWLKSNKLSLNTQKTFFMVFHRARLKTANCNDLVIDNASITRVNSAKYLGIIIDVKFNWIEHITYIKNKISKAIGIMYKARQYLNKSSLVNLYYSYVYPYLTYCIEVWGCAYPTHLQCLFLLQKKIIRIITFSHYLAHTEPLFMSLEILPLEKIFYHRCGLMMYKYHNNLLPCSISQLYAKNDSIHNHNTRCSNLLRVPHGSKSFTNVSARIWNVLNNIIDFDVPISTFKSILKQYLLSNSLILTYSK